MNGAAAWLDRLYARALRLYPQGFRRDFAEEMQEVFSLSVQDAVGRGRWYLLGFTLRELVALPLALLASYFRERKMVTMQKQLNRWLVPETGSWKEVLLASLPFVTLFFFLGLFSFQWMELYVPSLVGLVLLGIIALFLAVLGIAGMFVKLPRWAMPYAGVLISGAVFFVLMLLGLWDLFFGQLTAPWWLRMVAFEAIFLLALVIALILIVWLSQKIPLTRSFSEKVGQDRSLLSFAMYGGALILVIGMYEDIPNAELYFLFTILPLLFGVWVYLRQQTVFGRMIALSLSVTVAMGIALAANVYLVDWVSPIVFSIGGIAVSRTILAVILSWLLCEAMLFIPLLLPRIPSSESRQARAA